MGSCTSSLMAVVRTGSGLENHGKDGELVYTCRGQDFFEADYELPGAARKATTMNVRFAAAPGSTAGGIYEVRLLK